MALSCISSLASGYITFRRPNQDITAELEQTQICINKIRNVTKSGKKLPKKESKAVTAPSSPWPARSINIMLMMERTKQVMERNDLGSTGGHDVDFSDPRIDSR